MGDHTADRLSAPQAQGNGMSQRAFTTHNTLKLTGRWSAELMVVALVVTAAAMVWLVWFGMSNPASAGLAEVPFYVVGTVALVWIMTLSLLSHWRSADREEYRRALASNSELTRRATSLATANENHKAAMQEMDTLLRARDQTICDYEEEARDLRVAAEQALAGEREASAGDRAKSEYLARMSGDIRGPLTTILGFATTLLDMGDLSKAPRERVEALYTIKQKGEQLLDTIDDTLELCEIELQQRQVNRRCCSPVEIVDNVYGLMAGWAEARGLQLLVDYKGQAPEFINTDPECLSQMLINLLGNAVKFTLAGDIRLRISLIQDDHEHPQLCFEVVDSGIGMHKDQSSRLFGGFVSAASKEDCHPRTSGLGLTISKRYAEMLGGDLVLLDTLPGVGTRIRLTICVGSLEGVEMVQPPPMFPEADQPLPSTQTNDALETDPVDKDREADVLVTEAAGKSDAE